MSAPSTLLAFPAPPAANLMMQPPASPQSPITPPLPDPTDTQITDSLIANSIVSNFPPLPTPPSPTPPPTHSQFQKESAPISEPIRPQETAPLVEVHEAEKIPEEVEGWLQKLNQAGDINLPNPITHDGDILLANTEAQVVKEKLVLPLSESGVKVGLKGQVSDSARWLAEWCVRLVKMIKGGVKYAPEPASRPPEKTI